MAPRTTTGRGQWPRPVAVHAECLSRPWEHGEVPTRRRRAVADLSPRVVATTVRLAIVRRRTRERGAEGDSPEDLPDADLQGNVLTRPRHEPVESRRLARLV